MSSNPSQQSSVTKAPLSLAARLVLSAMIWSAIALIIAGVVVIELYRASLVRSFDERLIAYQKTIIGRLTTTEDGEPLEIGSLGEPRFLTPLSGWYWLIRTPEGQVLAASQSLYGDALTIPSSEGDGSLTLAQTPGPRGEPLRFALQRVGFGPERRTDVDVIVTGNKEEIESAIASFRWQIFLTLGIFALGLGLATVLQVRFALRPLEAMRQSLSAIRAGHLKHLSGSFPREITPLAHELNALIDANDALVERARAHVGNLAHGLKTPLSVLINEATADRSALGAKVIEQTALMRGVIERYLTRARLAAERQGASASVPVMKTAVSLARVLERAYADKALSIQLEGAESLAVRVEKQDFQEMLGNVMDNACKFGAGVVHVHIATAPPDVHARPMLNIVIEDNGPGVAEEHFVDILNRGRRLDETVPGSGLGLAIVKEIAEIYGGKIALGRASRGGLAVMLTLPRS